MPDEMEGKVAQEQATSAQPASTTSQAPEENVTMTRTEFEAFGKAQREPLEKKYSDAEAELGRIRKLTKLPPEAFEAEKNFESMKRIVTTLGVPEDEIQDAETVRELELLLRGHQRSVSKPVTRPPEGDSQYGAFLEWQKTNARPSPATPARTNSGGPVAPALQVDKDNIDALYLEGKVSGEKYAAFLRTGQL